jgi:hypothetical protein
VEEPTPGIWRLGVAGGVVCLLAIAGLGWMGLAYDSATGNAEGPLLALCWLGLLAGIVLIAVAVVRSSR